MRPLGSMIGRSAARRLAAWSTLLLLPVLALGAPSNWQAPDAPLRYKVELGRKPSHPSAGYYVHLPDGGILHGSTPATQVMTEDGKVVPSFLLWQNPESGFSIVFADPGAQAKSVNVYIQSARLPQVWRPETGLTPSAILCSYPGRENMGAAQALGKFGHVDAPVHSNLNAGFARAAFSIGGDENGHPRPGVFYQLSYLEVATAGKHWFAPFVNMGQCDVVVDGNKIIPKEQSKLWGGTGAFADLTVGLHRVEVFQTAPGTGPYPSDKKNGGLMYLTWRPPKAQFKGVESRVIEPNEIVQSGNCTLTSVEARDGNPVALIVAKPGLCYWFGEEDPLIIYELRAVGANPPAGTTWSWTFPDGGTVDGNKAEWIFPGFRDSKVKLTVKSGQATSTATATIFGFTTLQTSLDKPAHREAFRSTLATMLQAYPRTPDPVGEWNEAWWNNLMRTVEGGEGYPLLQRLFADHFEAARKKLAPAQFIALQDMLLDLAQQQNPRDALQWLQKFQPAPQAQPSPRLVDLKLREGELQMYYLGDRKQAEKIFTALADLPGESGERAKIRLGDLAFISGDLNKATSFYADVQNRARTRRNAAPALPGLVATQLVQGGPATAATPAPTPLKTPGTPPAPAPDQKGGALQEVSLSENVRTLTEKNFILEARQALLLWESEFPLSKISGDYVLRESALYIQMQDWKRAQPMLEAYCREIDASSFLPDAASMLITCVKGSKESPASIRDIIEKVKGRLKYHPVASDLDKFLATAPKTAP